MPSGRGQVLWCNCLNPKSETRNSCFVFFEVSLDFHRTGRYFSGLGTASCIFIPVRSSKTGAAQGDNPQVAVNRYFIAGFDHGGCVGNAGNAGQAIFAGDNRAMDQHAAAAFDHRRSQGNDKGHIGIHRVTDQDLTRFEFRQIGMLLNHPGAAPGDTGSRRLTDKLSGLDFKRLPGLLLIRVERRGSMIQIVQNFFQVFGRCFAISGSRLIFHALPAFLNRRQQLGFDSAQLDVVIIPQLIAGPCQVEQLGRLGLLRATETA